jgi:hypothetical protein
MCLAKQPDGGSVTWLALSSLLKNALHPMSAPPSPSSSLNTRKEMEMKYWLPRFSTASQRAWR